MCSANIYTRLSVRITDTTKNLNTGSGCLYLTEDQAFVFTAAHVIGNQDHEYEIECFCRRDEVKADELDQYRYQVSGTAFKKHPDYKILDDEKQFNNKDVAGIRLEKRMWMDDLPCIQFTVPVKGQRIYFSGYPALKWDESIEFAVKCCQAKIHSTSSWDKRLQFDYTEFADWSSMGDVLKGFSGCGIYAESDANAAPLLVGILTSGQGKHLPHGAINAVSFSAIQELCRYNSWPSPIYTENITADTSSSAQLPPSNKEQLLRQLSEEVQLKIDEIRDLIREKKLEEALALYETFTQTTAYQNSTPSDKCYLRFIKAHCYLLLGDLETAETLLQEGISDSVPERYWHLVEKANILMNHMGLPDGDACLTQAESLLEEAISIGVKDMKAKIFKRYIDAIKSQNPLTEKLSYIHELISDVHMDPKGMQDLYNVEGALCAQAGEFEKAAQCFNAAYGVQKDAGFLIQSGKMYLQQAEKRSPEPDLLLMKKASDRFVQYLEDCGDALTIVFYREMGGAFVNCVMALMQYGLIIRHIDGIIAQIQDPVVVKRMYLMKAIAQIELDEPAYDTLKHLDLPDQKALFLHMDFKGAMRQYSHMLEEASVCGADAQAGFEAAIRMMEQYQTGMDEKLQSIHTIVCRIETFLANPKGALSHAVSCSLYDDRINGLLACKKPGAYKDAIEQYQTLFPEYTDQHELFRLYLPEICGEPDKTELLLLKYVTRIHNPQRMQCLQNFYFRQQNYKGLIDFYEGLMEDSDGLGQFARSNLIWAYLDYLTKPGCMFRKALKQFLKYKDEIDNQNHLDILEMRLNHRCYQYSKSEKWMKTADFWIKETHHEEEYRDAILISVHNLEKETAEYYYNAFLRHCVSSMPTEEQKKQCSGWIWPYFALTAPGDEAGTPIPILNEKLENLFQNARNRHPEKYAGWKLLHSAEQKSVIIDGPTLYYLSKYHLLPNVFLVADHLIITYSTIGWYLEHERYIHDPVIENIFQLIQTEKRILLSEASIESQCAFREKFGNEGWYLKGCHCLAKEQNIPVVGAYHNHQEMLDEMQPHLIWAGDFIAGIV